MLKRIKNCFVSVKSMVESLKEVDMDEITKKYRGKIEDIKEDPINYGIDLLKKISLVYKMFDEWHRGSYELPKRSVVALIFILLYFINPKDVIPDFIPGIGYLDDILVLGLALFLIEKDLQAFVKLKGINLNEQSFL